MNFFLGLLSRYKKRVGGHAQSATETGAIETHVEEAGEAGPSHAHGEALREDAPVEPSSEHAQGEGELETAESAMFSSRSEHKYFLRPERAKAFVEGVERHISAHRFTGPDANPLPRPVHYVTTLYFDTQEHEIFQACDAGTESIKLRAREYYDEHPELAELATSEAQLLRHDPKVWLEVKARSGPATRKVRFSIDRGEVGAFLSEGVISEDTLASQRETFGESAEAVFDEIGRLCTQTRGPLRPDCLVHYRRRAWEDDEGELRVTLDTRLSYHRAPPNMFERGQSLREVVSSSPVGSLGTYLVEVKLRLGTPLWLRELMEATQLEPARVGERSFSKFLAASRAVHDAA